MRLKSDLFSVFQSVVNGNLGNIEVEWSGQSSACVVLASEGYPGAYKTMLPISGLDAIGRTRHDLQVFHAGTLRPDGGQLVTSGGRVLGITALGTTLQQALENCYGAIEGITWEGMQYRRDIGQFKYTGKPSDARVK
jgi:phosphoribosylamine---glycine ligase